MREPRRNRRESRRERDSFENLIMDQLINNNNDLYGVIYGLVSVAVEVVCGELEIVKPIVKISDEFAQTGCYVPEIKELHIGRRYANLTSKEDLIRLMEIIAHELRHKWQFDNNHANLEDSYITAAEDKDAYKNQWIEKDAYAYGEEHREELANLIIEIMKIS